MKGKKLVAILTGFSVLCVSCNTGTTNRRNDIFIDEVSVKKGKVLFNEHCAGCHNFRQDAIGPNLSGITSLVTRDWLHHFISDPKQMMESTDERAQQLAKKYKMIMPSFSAIQQDDIDNIIAFLHTQQHKDSNTLKQDSSGVSNPIPASIKLSNLVVNLQPVTQIPPSNEKGELPLTRITKIEVERGSGTPFVLDLRGKLYKLEKDIPAVYLDMAKLRPAFIHEPRVATGFGSFSFHPDFANNGLLYTSHSESAGTARADFNYADSIKVTLQWVVTEWKASNPAAATFSGTGRELLRVNMVTGMHGIQEIAFNPLAKKTAADYGLLYICVGDGASVEEGYPELAHSKEKVWGTVLRIDPAGRNSANGRYGIPAGNPFARNEDRKSLKELYAYGFRNPHRITWTKSGEILVTNIGQGNIESINLLRPGGDYGWPIREGAFSLNPLGDLNKLLPLPPDDSLYQIIYPVAAYDHDEGIAIAGGVEYWGEATPALKGKFVFGDIVSGRIFFIKTADIQQGHQATIEELNLTIKGNAATLLKLCGSDRVDLHLGRDAKGEIYILTKADGKIYQLTTATSSK